MKTTITILTLCLLTLGFSQTSHAGMVEFFFPTLKDQSQEPSQTLRAPFAEATPTTDEATTQTPPPASLPENSIPLDKPHRVTREITEWAATASSEALNFNNADKLFNSAGKQQFNAFLQQNNIQKVLDAGNYKVRSYVENSPLLLNEGVVQGQYRWLYQVPMVVTYIDNSASSYTDTNPISQKATITIQIGRSKDAQTKDAIWIESWNGTISPMDEKSK